MSLRHICTRKEESQLVGYFACEDVGGGHLLPFLTALDIIKLINLMVDPERFKRQSPVTTDSLAVKCKRLWTESLEKETAIGPMRKQE